MSDGFDFDDLDMAELRPVILDVAERVLTQRQVEIFVLHFFAGQSVIEVAHAIGIKHQVASEAINGREGRHPGILKRMGDALKDDTTFQQALADMKNPPTKKSAKGSDFIGWFKKMPPNQFQSMSVLLYANALADNSHRVSVGTLCEHMPPAIVNAALQPLRVMGYIMTDGITVSILKTPLEQKEVAA